MFKVGWLAVYIFGVDCFDGCSRATGHDPEISGSLDRDQATTTAESVSDTPHGVKDPSVCGSSALSPPCLLRTYVVKIG